MPTERQDINYGAAPNDGTGDPLRTAFIKTDDNFEAIWAAGPVGSNVVINDTTVSVVQVNGNLTLAANGVGVIQTNTSLVPRYTDTFNLGSANLRYRTVYVGSGGANILGNLSVSGTAIFSGDVGFPANVTVGGNLTVEGDIIQIGNIVTDTLTIQLANTAANAGQANGAGITVGASDDIATLLYDAGNNTWNTNIGITSMGAISGTALAVSDATVYGNVNALIGNFTGNITANSFIGDGSQLTGIVSSYGNANVVANLAALGSNPVTTTGNVTAGYFIGNGSQLTGLPAGYANADAVAYAESGWAGNIIPQGNGVYSLGNATNYWSNLWVANNTIYIGGVALGVTGNVLTVAGEPVLSNDSDATITTTGNITANYFIGDGSQLSNLPAGGIVFEYDIANYTANVLPAPGTMQFTNRDGDVVTPDVATKLFVNATDGRGLDTGSTWLAMTQNSERGTLTLQAGNNQQPYRVSNIGVYNTPEVYRGYRAGVNQIWGDDPSINQIIISNAADPVFYNENFEIELDVFHATDLADATAVYMVNVYGSDDFSALSQTDLWNFFTSFVDNVIYQGTDTETQDVTEIRTAFYTNFNNFYFSLPTTAYDRNFRFASSTTYYPSVEASGEVAGTGARLRVRLNVDYTYTVMGIAMPGTGYLINEVLQVLGTDLGGVSPDNDLLVTISTIDGNGGITAVVINSGVAAYPWRNNSISDGGDDQYDTGNRINTNLAQSIIYAGGNVTAGTTTFGLDSEYAVMYNNSIFCMAATGVDITDLYYSGNLGADGEGFLRWSGLRSPNSATSVQYAYMDCAIGTGDLEPVVGDTYQVALDSGGINFSGFYSYLNDADSDWYFGADRDWRLESRQQLFVQSYSDLRLRTLIPNEAAGISSPDITISTDTGSDGNGQYNQQAGSGGTIQLLAGSAGFADGVSTLGGNGGSITIIAGAATGNGQAGGGVLIEAGDGAGGTAGNLTLRTRPGTTANGAIVLETNDINNSRFWTFDPAGNLNLPLGGTISEGPSPSYLGDAVTITPANGNDPNQQLKIYPTLAEGNHLHLTSGNLAVTDVFLGDDRQYIRTTTTEGMTIGTGGGETFDGYTWAFDNTGVLTLPGNTIAINYLNGNLAFGTVTFNNEAVIGTGTSNTVSGLYLAPDPGAFTDGMYLRVRGNTLSEATHIHFDTGNNQYFSQFIGDDNKYVELSNTGNIVINTSDYAENTAQWTFGIDGTLTFPGSSITIGNAIGAPAIVSAPGTPLQLISSGNNIGAILAWIDDLSAATQQAIVVTNNPLYVGEGDVGIVTGNTLNVEGGTGYIWNFDNAGNLTLPRGGIVYETGIPGGALSGNAIALTPQGGTDVDQQLLIYPTVGPVTDINHLHLTTGNLYNTELFLGNDDLYVKLANTGNVVINSNDAVGNTAQWIFDVNGVLSVAGNINFGGDASAAPSLNDFRSVISAVDFDIVANTSGTTQTFTFDGDGDLTVPGNVSATGNITGNYFIGDGSQLTSIAVPSQTLLPTIQSISITATSDGSGAGFTGTANVTVANVIPVTEYGVIITSGTSNEKYATGSLGSIPGTVQLTFDTGLNLTNFTVSAYVTSNAGTFYSNSATGTSGICLLAGTQIALSDGSYKAIEDITYTDKMLSWDFDRGCYAETTAMWIKRGETGSQYNLLTFSDGTTLRTFDQHRIFNKQAGAFTYPMTDATPVGTITVNEHGQEITLTDKQVIVDTIQYYNVITHYYMNLFSDSVLTSCRFNNIYPITDMKFVKDGRTLRTRDEFENVEDRFFHGLRLAEQTTDIETVEWYVNRLISTEVSTQLELTF